MKQSVLLVCLIISQFGFSQTEMDFDGFDKIRLGMSFDEIKKVTKEVDEAPSYAWFYSANYEEMNFEKRWCIPKKKADQKFFGLTIECIECMFEDDILIKITIVLDSADVTFESKEFLKLDMLRQMSELEPFCSGAAIYTPPPSECVWYCDESGRELVFSDAAKPTGAPGVSVNIVFGGLFQ